MDRMVRTAFVLVILLAVTQPLPGQAPDRDTPPALGPPPSLSLPPMQHFELSNGLRVVIMEKHGVPLVQVDLLVHSGTVSDPDGKVGLASLTASMLDEGAGEYSALELADAIDMLGADISVGSGIQTSWVDLHTPLAQLEDGLSIMSDIILRPTFSAEELGRQRQNRLTSILQWHDEPGVIADRLFSQTLFGASHPYGRSGFGDEEGLRAINAGDLRNFHATHFTPGNSHLIVVGDITPATVIPLLEDAFGQWRGDAPGSMRVSSVRQVSSRRVLLVDKPGAAQSEIRIGRVGVDRMTDDYYPLLVMNTVLGGSFASRLNQNLREEHGYTYGARSSFSYRKGAGPFTASAAVQTDVTDSALVEFMRELNAIVEPISPEELNRARNFVALRFPGRFQTVAGVANRISEFLEYGLPEGYFNGYVSGVLNVSIDETTRVAREYLDPDKMIIVVVGDRERIEAGIRALHLGPLEIISIEDVLGAPPQL